MRRLVVLVAGLVLAGCGSGGAGGDASPSRSEGDPEVLAVQMCVALHADNPAVSADTCIDDFLAGWADQVAGTPKNNFRAGYVAGKAAAQVNGH
jgi:hypothetical protein